MPAPASAPPTGHADGHTPARGHASPPPAIRHPTTRAAPAAPTARRAPPHPGHVSQDDDLGDRTLWNPSHGASRLSLREVAVFEAERGVPSGLGPMEDDACEVDPAALGVFVDALLGRHRRTRHAVIHARAVGFVAAMPVLTERAGVGVRWESPESAPGDGPRRTGRCRGCLPPAAPSSSRCAAKRKSCPGSWRSDRPQGERITTKSAGKTPSDVIRNQPRRTAHSAPRGTPHWPSTSFRTSEDSRMRRPFAAACRASASTARQAAAPLVGPRAVGRRVRRRRPW